MMRRALLAAAALAALLGGARAQVYAYCNMGATCRLWHGTATTGSSGTWSVSYPAGLFTRAPHVVAQAVSSGPGLSASAQATVSARDAAGASGLVTLPATLVVGGLPVMAAGAGVQVDVVAVGE